MSDFKEFSDYHPKPQSGPSRPAVLVSAMVAIVLAGAGVFFMLAMSETPESETTGGAVIQFEGLLAIEGRLNEFLVLVSRGEYEPAYDLLSDTGRRAQRFAAFEATLRQETLGGYARLEITRYELDAVTRVTGNAWFGDGSARPFEALLEQTNGVWWILSFEID